MSNDIYNLISKLDEIGKPKQLPALFKPKTISPVLDAPGEKKHPTAGYFVGEGDIDPNRHPQTRDYGRGEENAMRDAVTRRIMNQHPEWIMKYGVEALMQAIDDVTEGEDDFEEIGSSDVSAYVRYVKDRLDDHMGDRSEMDDRKPFAESATTEDVISSVKKKLGDYLADLSQEIKKDPDLKDKMPSEIDQIGPAVKTITTDDGHEIKIHGNEDDGFRITIKNQPSKTKFENLDEAVMACEMFCSRRRSTNEQNTDYMEEK